MASSSIVYISSSHIFNSVCWSHALVNGPTSKRPASDGGRCSGQLLMMWSAVCSGSPHSHAALSASPHFFMEALYRPTPVRSLFRVVQCFRLMWHTWMAYFVLLLPHNDEESLVRSDPDPDPDHLRRGPSHGHNTCVKKSSQSEQFFTCPAFYRTLSSVFSVRLSELFSCIILVLCVHACLCMCLCACMRACMCVDCAFCHMSH